MRFVPETPAQQLVAVGVAVLLSARGVAIGVAIQPDEVRTKLRPAPAREIATVEEDIPEVAVEPAGKIKLPPTGGRPLRVLFVGDSLRAGLHATSEGKTYPNLVTAAIRKRRPAREFDASKITAGEGPSRFRLASSIKAVPKDMDLTFVQLGTNDWQDIAVSQFSGDYAALIKRLKRASPGTKLGCLSVWRSPEQDGVELSRRTDDFNNTIRSLCEEEDGVYIDVSYLYDLSGTRGPGFETNAIGSNDENPTDDFHPNDEGHARIAEAVLEQVAGA